MKNSNRYILLGGVVGLMLTAVSPVFADGGAPGAQPWLQSDANKDGTIDRAEFDTGRAAHFKTIDASGDGFITAEEMKTFQDKMHAKMDEKRGDMGAKFFKRFDANADGKIAADEWPKDGRLKFDKADANGDGAVTADEFSQLKPRDGKDGKPGKDGLARLDTDKDGKVSAAEWNAAGDQMFARLDDNKDGKIEKGEFPKHRDGNKQPDGDAPVLP